MLNIKSIKMKNFFSFGNVEQVIELNQTDLALILGQNNDAGTDSSDNSGSRNGVGKSAITQGIVFGLYGKSINNSIKINNLVNKINEKNCEVTILFDKNGVEYCVERGRNPTYFKFYAINGADETRGESKDTQEELNEILGISQTLFENFVIFNTNVQPFLTLSASKQREIIEELVSITQLTEKANLLKDMHKETKRLCEQEKFKIETITASNEKILKSIEVLQEQANNFEKNKKNNIKQLEDNLKDFEGCNFDELLVLASLMEDAIAHNNKRGVLENRVKILEAKRNEYSIQLDDNKNKILHEISKLSSFDIESEIQKHDDLSIWYSLEQILKESINTKRLKEQNLKSLKDKIVVLQKQLSDEEARYLDIINSTCPLCKNSLEHDESHSKMKEKSELNISVLKSDINTLSSDVISVQNEILEIEIFDMPEKPVTFYKTISDAKLHEHKLNELINESNKEMVNIYDDEFLASYTELQSTELKEYTETFNTNEVKDLKRTYETLYESLQREKESVNPYFEQIQTLKSNSIQSVSYDEFNKLYKLAEHQDFMSKLLMNKDSYIRKLIIEQNISFLNSRLSYYTEQIGLLHSIEFMNDLSVNISLMGRDYDYSQLSRGERTRVFIALNLAFRDTYESMHQSINILIIDEALEDGIDTNGLFTAWNILRDISVIRSKNVFVVSHREELFGKCENILKVTKENNFSTAEYINASDL